VIKYIIVITILICCTNIWAGETFGNFDNVEYVKNYDGDTITFNIKNVHPLLGKKINIRVSGIDTPEIRGKCIKEKFRAQDAKFFVENMCRSAKKIDLRNISRGKYFRILADVYCDDVSISKKLIDNQLAVIYNGGKKISWCD